MQNSNLIFAVGSLLFSQPAQTSKQFLIKPKHKISFFYSYPRCGVGPTGQSMQSTPLKQMSTVQAISGTWVWTAAKVL